MKHLRVRTFVFALTISFFSFAAPAFAIVPPTLSLSATGSGDSVQVNITGDPNVSVLLSYTQSGSGPQIVSLGTTNGSGSFSTTISSASYGLVSGTPVTAILNGTSGPKSPTIAWPTVTSANALALNPNALVISAGQSGTVTATNLGSSSLYVSNNSNPSIANVNINGTQATITGNLYGSTNITLCAVGSASNCPSIYVFVQNSGSSQLSLSQNNVSVVAGQNLPITVSGANGSYQIQNNSNPSVIQASVSGSVVTLSTGSSSGSASITVCSTDMAACAVITASAGSASSVAISFSSSAPVVSMGGTTTVNIYGPSGVTFYVSSNSTPSIVQANLSGTQLTLTGIAAGTSAISVCSSTSACASLTATVNSVSTGANIALSQTTLSLTAGQNVNIAITGGAQPYTMNGGTSSVAQTSINGSTLTAYGIATGSSSVNVCSAGGGCINLLITVNGGSSASSLSLSQNSVALTIGQNTSVSLSGNGSYYVSSNTGPSVATASISGSSALVTGVSQGSTSVSLCQTGGSCATLFVTVTATPASTPTPTTSAYTFTQYLTPGSQNADVLALQKLLTTLGYLTATPNGYYGAATEKAVLKFQAANKIAQLGVVGPATRTALNQLASTGGSSTSGMTLAQLQAQVQSLQAQLAQVLAQIAKLTGQ